MGGKTGTTTSQVTIPPEVLQRYTAVNKLAEQTAQTPFQPYTGQFVAPLTATQQSGIAQTQAASQAAQPYFGAATQNLLGAQAAAAPSIAGAGQTLAEAQQAGRGYADVAGQLYGQAGLAASPYYQAATRGTQAALRGAQPYQQAATQFGLAGAQGIDPSALNIGAYMSPYTQAVASTTQQALQQQQQQEMAGQLGNAIRSGAFGGDRAGIVAANLARQQQLGMAQAMAPIYQQGYAQALQAAQQQQGLGLSAAQANRAALQQAAQQMASLGQQGYGQQLGAAQQMAGLGQALYGQALGTGQAISGLGQQQFGQGATTAQQQAALAQQLYGMGAGTAQQLAALGTGAQQAGLQGAQATIGAGTLEQQTQQAQDTAKYQQFLQERGYPFQVAQFLANIAMGTGALSGSTTTTQQPIPFFSDRRLKDDVKQIGKTNDGMPIYSFKYKGDDATQIGLMAQDVEKKHPEAVGLAGGYKTVDYAKATEDSARPEKADGGLVPSSMGGSVYQSGAFARGGYAIGGDVIDSTDLQAILAQQQAAFGPFGDKGLYGATQHQSPYAAGVVPQQRLHTPKLATASAAQRTPESITSQATDAFDTAMKMRQRYQDVKSMFDTKPTPQETMDQSRSAPTKEDTAKMAGPDIVPAKAAEEEGLFSKIGKFTGFWADGGVVPRSHYDLGGTAIDPYRQRPSASGVPEDVLEKGEEKVQGLKSANSPSNINKGPGDDIMKGLQMAKMGYDVATTILPFFLSHGGVVPRDGYREGGDPPKYKIQPLDVENMPEHRQELIRGIYGPESGGRYDIMQGGQETFDTSGPHPGRVGRGGQSTAAGAGQFIKGTWEDVTGGAPMTKPYQDAATWALASRDYKARTGKDLDATLQKEGFSPAVKSALARTWTALSGGTEQAAQDKPAIGAKPAQAAQQEEGKQPVSLGGLGDFFAENQGWLAPLGAGIKGMVQSKSPFLGAAILEGVGAGLEAYPGAQQTQALTGLTKAQTAAAQAETTTKSFHTIPGVGSVMWVQDKATGQVSLVPFAEYRKNIQRYNPAFGPRPTSQQIQQMQDQFATPGTEPSAAPSAAAPAAGSAPRAETAPAGATSASAIFDDQSAQAAQKASDEVLEAQGSLIPGAATQPIEEGNKYRQGVYADASVTRKNFPNTMDYIKNLTKAAELNSWQSTGTASELRGDLAKFYGTFARAFGASPDINLGDVNDIQNKMKALRGQMQSQQAGQESFAALEMLGNAMAQTSMSPNTMAKLGALMLGIESRALDRLEHADAWGAKTGAVYYKAGNDFERIRPVQQFEQEVNAIAQLIELYPAEMRDMFTSSPEEIDRAFKENFGLDNMSRYFRTR